MKAGDFFINLGLTGAEKMAGGLSQINDHFSGLKGISTEAKLAILAALAGLEQIVAVSGKFGNSVTKNTQFLNIGNQAFQQWEASAQRFGAAAGVASGTLQKIQDTMNDIWAGKGPPQFLPTVMSMLKNAGEKFTPEEMAGQSNYWQKHPEVFAKHIVNASNLKGIDKGRLGYILSQMGIDQDFLNVAKMGAFSDKNLQAAKRFTVSDYDISQMNMLNTQWKTFELETEKIMHLFSVGLVPMVAKMADWATVLADKFEHFRTGVEILERNQNAKGPSDNDLIFAKMHPELYSKMPGHGVGGSWTGDVNVHVQGGGQVNTHEIKKAARDGVKEGIREHNRKERTGNIAGSTAAVSH